MPPPPEQSAGLVSSDPQMATLGLGLRYQHQAIGDPIHLSLGWEWGASALSDLLPFPPHLFSLSASLPKPSLSPPQRCSTPPMPAGSPPPLFPRVPSASTQRARWCIVSPAPAARRALLGQALGQGGAGGGGCQGAPWGRGKRRAPVSQPLRL